MLRVWLDWVRGVGTELVGDIVFAGWEYISLVFMVIT